jgi:hypothetical protein
VRREAEEEWDKSRGTCRLTEAFVYRAGQETGMADDPSKQGSQGRQRINTLDDREVVYWTEKWKVSDDELLRAVYKVGPMVDDVARELGRA